MADDGGETTPYEWFLYVCRRLVHWGSFVVVGVFTLIIFWFHWGNAYSDYGVKWYDVDTAGLCGTGGATTYAAVICPTQFTANTVAAQTTAGKCTPGDNFKVPTSPYVLGAPAGTTYCNKDTTTWCLVKATPAERSENPAKDNGGWNCGPLSDNNKDWRRLFSFAPKVFIDMFTPVVFGAIETIQHFGPTYSNAMISGTWIVRAIWLFTLSLFAQFGYAGDFGVLCGYIVDFGVVLPCIALAILDHESDEAGLSVTTADVLPTLKWLLELCGLDGLCPGLTNVKAREITKDDVEEQTASA